MDHVDGDVGAIRSVVAAHVAAVGGQRALAREMGIPQATLSRFLTGGPLTLGLALALSDAFPMLSTRLGRALMRKERRRRDAEPASVGS